MENPKRLLLTLARLAAFVAVLRSRGAAGHLSGLVFTALWIGPTVRRNSQWHGPVMTRFSTARREVWLTIDDGPNPETTSDFLDVLDAFGAKATFFVIGRHVDGHRPLCREILRRGHGLGNHSASHPSASWWAFPPALVRKEILSATDSILAATGLRPRFFRPPVGMCPSGVRAAAKEWGLQVIGWSASGSDGCPQAPSLVVKSLLAQVTPGSILLLHEGDRARQRILTLSLLLKALHAEGYQCVIPEPGTLMAA